MPFTFPTARLEQGKVLDSRTCVHMASEILRGLGFEQAQLRYEEGEFYVVLSSQTEREMSPYLTWHLEQATGCKIQLEVQVSKVEEVMRGEQLSLAEPETLDFDERFQELEYVREEWSQAAELYDVAYQADEFQELVMPVKSSKAGLGLKARLEKMVQESRDVPSPVTTEEEPRPRGSGESSARGETKKRLSIQERMKAIKAESLGKGLY